MKKKINQSKYDPIELDVKKGSEDYMLLRGILRPNSASGMIFLHSGWFPLPEEGDLYHFMIGCHDFEKFFKQLIVQTTPLLVDNWDMRMGKVCANNMIFDLIFHLYGYLNFNREEK